MISRKERSSKMSLVWLLTLLLLLTFIFAQNIFAATELSDLAGVWELKYIYADGDVKSSENLGITGKCIVASTAFYCEMSLSDNSLIGTLSPIEDKDGMFIVDFGAKRSVVSLSGSVLMFALSEETILGFVKPEGGFSSSSSGGNSSYNDYSVPSAGDTAISGTSGEKGALSKANSYLSHSAFSYDGLIDQLEYHGYSHQEAVFAADHCGADWNEQAAKKAASYLSHSSFSRTGLIDQLEYNGFTYEQAVYGADHCGTDWDGSKTGQSASKSNALEKAKSYLSHSAFSYEGLIDQLEYNDFTHEEAVYAADNCGADWKEQAVKKAKSYLSHSSFTKERLIDQLEYNGFTHEQAVYGAGKAF